MIYAFAGHLQNLHLFIFGGNQGWIILKEHWSEYPKLFFQISLNFHFFSFYISVSDFNWKLGQHASHLPGGHLAVVAPRVVVPGEQLWWMVIRMINMTSMILRLRARPTFWLRWGLRWKEGTPVTSNPPGEWHSNTKKWSRYCAFRCRLSLNLFFWLVTHLLRAPQTRRYSKVA